MLAKDTPTAASIFDGTDRIIHAALGLQNGQSLKQISTCQNLCRGSLPASLKPDIVSLLFAQIIKNWTGRVPSAENWRQERRTAISDNNRSLEVVLERAIVTLADLGELTGWYNQTPVASGLVNARSDKRAALDLIRIDGEFAELVELKWASDTPLFALFEVLRYGLALVFSRQNAQEFRYSGRPLIEVSNMKLVVLAPAQYYSGYDLGAFEEIVNHGLEQLSLTCPDYPEMGFQFLKFPESFELPIASGAELNAMKNGNKTAARLRIRKAVNSLQPVVEPTL
ncbi:hypothetical protein [Ruegeria sp.]|uniref:hypothetical protein n=1 Tax=Ruegeria sp. TaxID=1879320 RepID=UPI003B59D585